MHIDYLMKQLKNMEEENQDFDLKNSFIYKIFQFCYITNSQLHFERHEKDYELSEIYYSNGSDILIQDYSLFPSTGKKITSSIIPFSRYFDNCSYNFEKLKRLEKEFIKTFNVENRIIFISLEIENHLCFKQSRSFLIINNFLDTILEKIGDEWQYPGKKEIGKIIEETYKEYFDSIETHTNEEVLNLIKSLKENNDETWFKQNMLKMFNDLKNNKNHDEWYENLIKKI